MKNYHLPAILLIVFLLISVGWAALWLRHTSARAETEQTLRILRYDRLEEDFISTGSVAAWQRMNTEFPLETRTLIEDILRLGKADSEGIEDSLRVLYSDPVLRIVRADVAREYTDISSTERQLDCAFDNLRRAIPGFVTPKVYTQLSALHESIVIGDSLIGISLDKYLGSDYPLYRPYFSANQRATMERRRIVTDALTFYLRAAYPYVDITNHRPTLVDAMLGEGKIAWVTARVTGRTLMDVAACQPATKHWYRIHEREAWRELQDAGALTLTDPDKIHSIVFSSDNNPYFRHPNSRGIGLWIGMRIIDRYMQTHPRTTLNDLIHMEDYQKILRESGY